MQVRRLEHAQLAIPNGRENEARAFYQDTLGIPEVAKPASRQARRVLV